MPTQPLAGVRVLDLTRLLPGAQLTLVLADLGADVVKIEDPRGGDPARTLPPGPDGSNAYFEVMNRNKRSMTLNLKAPGAAAVLDRLIARADVVVESFRPQTARRLGVDAATLRGRHPRLIHASISGFGQSGPWVARAAHDINYEALAGLLSVGRVDLPPLLVGDIGAAMHAAAGILAALYQRERTGAGASVDVSIHEAALAWLAFPAARQLAAAGHPDAIDLPVGGTHACYNVYTTADDRHVALGALEPKFWEAFCGRIGRPDLAPRQYVRGEEQAQVLAEVRALMRTRSRDEWLAFFSGIDVCLTPVNTVAEALADPHLAARGALARHAGTTYVRTPITVTQATTASADDRVGLRPAPALGAHTDEVLAEAGVTPEERAGLRDTRVIGP